MVINIIIHSPLFKLSELTALSLFKFVYEWMSHLSKNRKLLALLTRTEMRYKHTHFNRQVCLFHPYTGMTALFHLEFSEKHKVLICEGLVLKYFFSYSNSTFRRLRNLPLFLTTIP
jgi:hypothetical protein